MYQILHTTLETVQGTFNASATSGQKSYCGIYSDNGFTAQPAPIFWGPLMDATGSNRPIKNGSGQFGTKGSWATPVYISQAKLLLPWACSVAGTPLDLTTMTFDYAAMMAPPTNALWYERYLGCKCNQFRLSANNSGRGMVYMLNVDFDYMSYSDSITVTDLPTPALTALPTGQPMLFQMSAGNFTLSSSRTNFSSLGLTVKHNIVPMYDENALPNFLFWGGRTVTLTARIRFVSDADRLALLANTAETVSMSLFDGTNTIACSLHTNNMITAVKSDGPLGAAGYRDVTVSGMIDTAAGSDFDVTITP